MSSDNQMEVKQKVQEIDKSFDLVLIAEQFDQSLILLSDELCWPLQNVTSLKLNARKKSSIVTLSPRSRALLKEWLWADYILYNHFREKLERRIIQFGVERMTREVGALKTLNKKVNEKCVMKEVTNTKTLDPKYKPWSEDVVGFRVNELVSDCKYYGMAEVHLIEHLRQKQIKRHRKYVEEQ